MVPVVEAGMRNTDAPTKLATAVAVLGLTASSLLAPALAGATSDVDVVDERAPQQLSTGNWVDTQNRRAVIDSYNAEFLGTAVDPGWTGDWDTCTAGTTDSAFRTATIDRVNWFRSMAGVPATITENVALSALAQEAALMTSTTDAISHDRKETNHYSCRTENAATAAETSNLHIGRLGPHAISGYILDARDGNESVGHRNWILSPTARQFGTGDVPRNPDALPGTPGHRSTNALVVNEGDSVDAPSPELRESTGFVAWPARGYVPSDVVFERWSFGIRDADMSNATVTTESFVNGEFIAIASPIIHRADSVGAPLNTIVWEPALDFPTQDNPHGTMPLPKPATDQIYRVTISNVRTGGTTRTYSYDVTVIGEQEAPLPAPAPRGPTITGDRAFTNQAFNDFLGRNATTSELADWASRIQAGTPRYELIADLTQSDEWITVVVDRMYQDAFGRDADSVGGEFWIDQIRGGMTVAQVAGSFYGSPEYLANEDNKIDAWLDDLYIELMGRTSDVDGLRFWADQTAQTDARSVAFRFYQSDESAHARVQRLYQDLLGRHGEASGATFWSDVLISSGDDLLLATELASSDEYYDNASR